MSEKITPADAIRLLDAGRAVAVDVREPDEFAVGHIPGAKLLPLGSMIQRNRAQSFAASSPTGSALMSSMHIVG